MCVLWGHRLRYLRGGGEATWVSMGGGSHEGEEAGEGTGAEAGRSLRRSMLPSS